MRKIFLFVSALVVIVAGLTYIQRYKFRELNEADPSRLIDTFVSFSSTIEVADLLTKNGIAWQVVSRTGLEKGDSRPNYSIESWEIANYKSLGFEGRLDLSFFNGKLYRTAFKPRDIDGYRVALGLFLKREISKGFSIVLPPHTRIRFLDNPDGVQFDWVDLQIEKNMGEWIDSFA